HDHLRARGRVHHVVGARLRAATEFPPDERFETRHRAAGHEEASADGDGRNSEQRKRILAEEGENSEYYSRGAGDRLHAESAGDLSPGGGGFGACPEEDSFVASGDRPAGCDEASANGDRCNGGERDRKDAEQTEDSKHDGGGAANRFCRRAAFDLSRG